MILARCGDLIRTRRSNSFGTRLKSVPYYRIDAMLCQPLVMKKYITTALLIHVIFDVGSQVGLLKRSHAGLFAMHGGLEAILYYVRTQLYQTPTKEGKGLPYRTAPTAASLQYCRATLEVVFTTQQATLLHADTNPSAPVIEEGTSARMVFPFERFLAGLEGVFKREKGKKRGNVVFSDRPGHHKGISITF